MWENTADVLIVHDSKHFRDAYASALAAAGFGVRGAASPIEALDALDVRRPALLVTRVYFGEGQLHGAALTRMARYRHPGLPVILIARPQWAEVVSDVATSVLPHTATPDELVEAVKRTLAKK